LRSIPKTKDDILGQTARKTRKNIATSSGNEESKYTRRYTRSPAEIERNYR
jgi:hypothetical protein